MTLFGPFDLRNGHGLWDVRSAVETIAADIYELPFTIDGWEGRPTDHGRVIAFRVRPSGELLAFRRNLAGRLCPIAVSKSRWDCDGRDSWFHVTLAMGLPDRTYRTVMEYVEGSKAGYGGTSSPSLLARLLSVLLGRRRSGEDGIRPPYLPVSGLRVTILNRSEILAECDLVQKRWLARQESLSGREYARTLAYHRKHRGIELVAPRFAAGPEAFVIGDHHLGHAIINPVLRPALLPEGRREDGRGADPELEPLRQADGYCVLLRRPRPW